MTDGLFGLSRGDIVDALRGLRDEPDGEQSGLARLASLFERLGAARRLPPKATQPHAYKSAPTDQARSDAVRHRGLLTTYAQQVDKVLARLVPNRPRRRARSSLSQALVLLTDDGAGLSGRVPVENNSRQPATISFQVASDGVVISPATFELGPREARSVRIRCSDDAAPVRITVLSNERRSMLIRAVRSDDSVKDGLGAPLIELPQPDDDLDAIMRQGQLSIIKHPLAAEAIFRSFVAEGRRFGSTPEGAAWRERLAGSELVGRGRVVWEVLSQKVLEEASPTILPTKLLDAFVKAVEAEGLEPTLTDQMSVVLDDEDPSDPTAR